MTANEKRLAAALLRLASDQFANHGCNDLDLAKIVSDPDERDQLVAEARKSSGFGEGYLAPTNLGGPDWRLADWEAMDFIAGKLEAEAGEAEARIPF